MNSIFVHDLDACPDIEDTLIYQGSLQDAWLVPFQTSERDLFFKMWFLESFAPYSVYLRACALLREIDNVERDLAQLKFQETGEPTRISKRVQSMRKCRALIALWPTWKSVVDEATDVLPVKAQKNLYRLCVVDDKWLAR
jgi:hypothetical protein